MGGTTRQGDATDGWWWSRDGLRLHYREHGGGGIADADADRPPIICIPGLTRNARDFDAVAARLPGWRVIAVDLRGRGESAQARDPMTYVPLTYRQDIEALVETLGLERFVLFGTSLGGIVAMLLATTGRERLAGVLLNDIGPELDPRGLGRIRAHVGRGTVFPTWLHAARAIAGAQAAVHPGFALADWLAMAKRLCCLTPAGRIAFDYDMRIAEPFRIAGADDAIDLWAAAEALRGLPVALIRGALSDLLSEAVAGEMAARIGLDLTTVPDVGHVPTLDEPAAAAAIDRLLARVI